MFIYTPSKRLININHISQMYIVPGVKSSIKVVYATSDNPDTLISGDLHLAEDCMKMVLEGIKEGATLLDLSRLSS